MTKRVKKSHRGPWWSSPWLLAGVILLLGVLVSVEIARNDVERHRVEARSRVERDLANMRTRLESVVSSLFSATSGLVNVIAYQGGIAPDLFDFLAERTIETHPHIRNIVVAPDNLITRVFPLAGNERALGLVYAEVPDQYPSVLKAMQSRRPVLDGPRHLVQGGEGFLLRAPVFTSVGVLPGELPRYWGLASIVADAQVMLETSGVRPIPGLDIGLRQKSADGRPDAMIWGDPAVWSRQPVSLTIAIPGGEWLLAAVPATGWVPKGIGTSPVLFAGVLNSLLLAGLVWGLATRQRRVSGENLELLQEITERTRVEEQLRLSQQKYRNIFHLIPDMVGITRMADGVFIEVNSGFEKWTGWTKEEAVGRSSLELGLWDRETRERAVAIVRETGELKNFEFDICYKSGQRSKALMFLTTISIEGEKHLYFMAQDLTALKQAQQVLENERGRLRTLLQTIPALVWLKDPEGVYLACNSRFERLFGAREAEIMGRTDYDFVDAELADFFRENDKRAIAAGGPTVNEEWVTYAHDGHRELLETIKTPMRDAEGRLIGVLGIARDISESRRIEEELKHERLRFQNLVDSLDGIVWEADADSLEFTYVSGEAERLLGFPVSDWYRKGFWGAHLHPDDRDWAQHYRFDCVARGGDYTFEYRFVARDGRTVWLHDIVTIVAEDGRPRWLRGIILDTTDAKLKEAEKLQLEDRLRQAQKMEAIGRLAGGVAHDFNNKLLVILGYAEMAQRAGIASERYRDYLGQVVKAAEQSQEITRQLLAFSRQELISPRVLDLNDVVRGARKGIGRFIGEDIRFELDLAEHLWPVNMDPTQIDQIIMNLVVNARDAMLDGGEVTIETCNIPADQLAQPASPEANRGDYVRMTVRDTGCGMDQETQRHIFEPFFTTKESGKGTGLGLATVYGIVTQNQGFITVESEPGKGSALGVFLPRCDELDTHAETEASSVMLENPATILLVEDDESVRGMVAALLEDIGYTVLIARTPQEAIRFCGGREPRPDLLLTDVIMPDMNGRELAQRIEAVQPGIRALFMSGYTGEIIDQKGVLAEGLHFIQKPFDRATLHSRIQEVLDAEPG